MFDFNYRVRSQTGEWKRGGGDTEFKKEIEGK